MNFVVKGGHAFLVPKRTNGGQRVERVARLPKDTNRLAQCFATLLENKGGCRYDEGAVAAMLRGAGGVRVPLETGQKKGKADISPSGWVGLGSKY